MSPSTPKRRALGDLPVNTFGTPSTKNNIGKLVLSNKRPIDVVTEPEYPQNQSRPKISPTRSQGTVPNEIPLKESQPAIPVKVDSTAKSAMPHAIIEQGEFVEEMADGDSQNSFISNTDFDPDDTAVSQQTAATELTQPLQSRAGQHAENLRLRLRLAHFKVKTNQIHLPLSQLRISTTENQSRSPTQEPSLPKLLPAPILRPARIINQRHVPSSPPSSPEDCSGKSPSDEILRTPALPRQSITLRRTDNPPEDQERGSRQGWGGKDCLTSSAVRGNAAIGLLGLRQER